LEGKKISNEMMRYKAAVPNSKHNTPGEYILHKLMMLFLYFSQEVKTNNNKCKFDCVS